MVIFLFASDSTKPDKTSQNSTLFSRIIVVFALNNCYNLYEKINERTWDI